MFKNERHIINEWIDHHLDVGVDHIFLVDDNSNDSYVIDTTFVNNVTILDKPENLNQTQVYNHYLPMIKDNYDWVAVIDMDEFLYSKKHKNIKKILSNVDKTVTRFDIQMKLYPISSYYNQKSKIRYQTTYTPDSINHPKCISRTHNLKQINIHSSKSLQDKRILYKHDSTLLCINHDRFQSIEYVYGIKEQRGGGVHKNKYKQNKTFKPSIKGSNHIKDDWLKNNSKYIIKRCYKRNTPGPLNYSDSSWILNKHEISNYQINPSYNYIEFDISNKFDE